VAVCLSISEVQLKNVVFFLVLVCVLCGCAVNPASSKYCTSAEKCRDYIAKRILLNWAKVKGSRERREMEYKLTLDKRGKVVDIETVRGTGNVAFEHAGIQAIVSSAPYKGVKYLTDEEFEKIMPFHFKLTGKGDNVRINW